jgi:uracil-DNA glycosylase
MKPSREEIRGSLERYLETDLLLGIDSVPLNPPARRPAGSGQAIGPVHGSSAARTARSAAPPRSHSVPTSQAVSADELARRQQALKTLDDGQVKGCVKCGLSKSRTQTVFGQGNAAARLAFVGEAPGAEEDAQGLAFVGRAGQLLTKMIQAMGLTRDEVFICNIIKCRPPNNRDPAPDEICACWPYLDEQLRIIQPEVIVALGKPASQTLLRTSEGIGRLRGQWHEYFVSGSPMVGPPTPLMPTYHPAYLLRNPPDKGKCWSDLKMVMARLGLPVPQG